MRNLFNKQSNKFLPLYFIILGIVILMSSSYALLRNAKVGTQTYTMNIGNLLVNFSGNTNEIEISNMYPMTDEEGLAQNGQNDILEFTVSNDGSLKAKYNVYIEELTASTNPALPPVMKYSYAKKGPGETEYSEYSTPVLLSSDNYIEHLGVLDTTETASYRLKMWLDESADKKYMNKTFSAKIVVEALQYQMNKNEIMKSISMNNPINLSDDINFYEVNGNNNGNGLFVFKGTEEDINPIYFYRGNVTNNNIIFADYCWKIVRTTKTGGTKLIYNGSPTLVNGEKHCLATTTETELLAGKKSYNSSNKGPVYVGYSLPSSSSKYEYSTVTLGSTIYYGSSVDPITKKLVDPVLELNDTHHYSYNSSDINATGIANDTENVRYYYNKNSAATTSGTGYYIKFDKTKSISDIVNEMLTASNSKDYPSTIQGVINDWWGTGGDNSLDSKYSEYLEDTEWCNDRSINSLGGFAPDGTLYGSSWKDYSIVFNSRVRYDQASFGSNANNIKNTNTPVLTCSNPNDRLTVSNGNLTYPIGLLTYDEVAMAGARWSTENSNFYLYTGENYWLLSLSSASNLAGVGIMHSNGRLSNDTVSYTYGVRPAVSLKSGIEINGGTGEPNNPYTIKPLS